MRSNVIVLRAHLPQTQNWAKSTLASEEGVLWFYAFWGGTARDFFQRVPSPKHHPYSQAGRGSAYSLVSHRFRFLGLDASDKPSVGILGVFQQTQESTRGVKSCTDEPPW